MEQWTCRQASMLGGFMVFSAVVGVAPSLVTFAAGSTGWLAVFPAVLALLPPLLIWTAICRREGGFGGLCLASLGQRGSKLLFLCLALWNTVYAGKAGLYPL